MSSLFNHSGSLDVLVSVSDDDERQLVLDTATVGRKLWNQLVAISGGRDEERIAVSISCRQRFPSQGHSLLKSLTCWAVADANSTELVVPELWTRRYPQIFPRSIMSVSERKCATHAISVVQPVPLTEVFLMALSVEAYNVVQTAGKVLESWVYDGRILRQGDVAGFDSSLSFSTRINSPFQFRLSMVEPVLQGYALRDTTRIFVLRPAEDENSIAAPSTRNGFLARTEGDHTLVSDGSNDDEEFEIDERFLAGSVLSPPNGGLSTSDQELTHDTDLLSSGDDSIEPQNGSLANIFRAELLLAPVSFSADDRNLYLSTPDLGKLGILSGDWAIACPLQTGRNSRLVRAFANEDVVSNPGIVVASPILLHNITGDLPSAGAPQYLSIYASSFGSSQPFIPIARSVSIARVASPISVNRTYQPLLLQSLKAYFENSKCLVKQGDLIAVSINTDDLSLLRLSDAGAESLVPDAEEEEVSSFDINEGRASCDNEVAFFKITSVDYETLTNGTNSHPRDAYSECSRGELGCWIDSAVTRMVQTGIEHSRVPDVSRYLNISSESSWEHDANSSAFRQLYELSSAVLLRHSADYHLDLSMALKGQSGIGKFSTARRVAQSLGMHLLEINCYDLLGESDVKTEGFLRARFETAATCSPCVIVLRSIQALGQTTQNAEPDKESNLVGALKDCISDLYHNWKSTGWPVLVYATSADPSRVPSSLWSCFKHEIKFEVPDETERYTILASLLAHMYLAADVSVQELARQTAALVASDLVDLISQAFCQALKRAMKAIPHDRFSKLDIVHGGVLLMAADFDVAVAKLKASYSENIGAPKIPVVSWDDVGGLAYAKKEILETIQLPLEHPELFAGGLKKRSGILLYGPPGTGKTLLAKAVATSCSLNFFSVKGPELLNMYIGESEANVRRVFQRARDAKPCVVFFDELDSVAPKRGNTGDSGGVMDRIVSQLLAELDGMSSSQGSGDVFVIGATNRPDLLDPALLRPGRFDRMVYLGVSSTHEAQVKILDALTRKFKLDPQLRLDKIAEKCPFHYTGADFYALCSDAMLNAMSRQAEKVEVKLVELNRSKSLPGLPYPITPQYYLADLATGTDIKVVVSQDDFERALRSLIPSVSQTEMEHYARVQRKFSQKAEEES